uniref:NADAR domain-containing protein n=1 Tax=Acrobeloides nanus TaxID=290746 RepID=A0A914EQK7_9BILA
MDDGKIILIGNETDILHCGYNHAISDGGKRYPSADHYAHSMILSQLGLDDVHILELLATPSSSVPAKARELLQENMPQGHDMNSLANYLTTSRQSYTMQGLRLRAEQDKKFLTALLDTKDALLIVCDKRDSQLGIGMDAENFFEYCKRRRANAEVISSWMHDERARPPEVGQNQLGFFLMWLRYEIKEKERSKWMTTGEVIVDGLSTDQDDKPVKISASDFVIALQGIFQPLSNYYAFPFEMKGERYRSVEHYAYERLLESLKLDETYTRKLRSTVRPVDVARVTEKIIKSLKLDEDEVEHKMGRLDRWRQSAMKHKISKNEHLQHLLLSTGHAILLETTAEGDSDWTSGCDEFEMQHLLTKKYITPQTVVDWFCRRIKVPLNVAHLGKNKAGLLLMELRAKFTTSPNMARLPLISPLQSQTVRNHVSLNMICFTPESVLHPFYPVTIQVTPDAEPLPSPIHVVTQHAIKFLNINKEDAEWIMETKSSVECWERLHYTITECMMLPIDKIRQWYMDERQQAFKKAMQLQFEQHPSLLRTLLDTNDALLVSCARFSSTEGELNSGMRERDLRSWLSVVRVDTKKLIDTFLLPMAFRPPYFGGNRLGLILMELRREFILKGVFPQHLPELNIPVDAILGSESAMENFVPHYEFDILDQLNYYALWANAFLLLSKYDGNPTLSSQATSLKTSPPLISVDDARMKIIVDHINSTGGYPDENFMYNVSLEELRALYFHYTGSIKSNIGQSEYQQSTINLKARQISQLQNLRRLLEDIRERFSRGQSPSTVDKDKAMSMLNANAFINPPTLLGPPSSHRATPPVMTRERSPIGGRKRPESPSRGRSAGRAPPDPGPISKMPSSIVSEKDRRGDRTRHYDRFRRGQLPISPIRNRPASPTREQGPTPTTTVTPEVKAPPKKKIKKQIDEAELSEGEIVSSEEEVEEDA